MSDATKTTNVPVIDRVDWIVVGGCSAGISAAVALAKAGQSVTVVAPRSYVGEDIAGAFRFWDHAQADDHPLALELFGDSTPPTPMHVKLTLEKALLDAGVRLVLTTSPADVLRDEAGRVAGVVIANRAGQQVVLAGGVIDASWHGTLSRLAGHTTGRPAGVHRVTHVTLCHDEGTDADGVNVEKLSGYEGDIDNTAFRLAARRYELDVNFGDGSPDAYARAQAQITARCWVPTQYLHQEIVEVVDTTPGAVDASALSTQDFQLEPGLVTLSPADGARAAHRAALRSPVACINLGHRVGKALAWSNPGAPRSADAFRAGNRDAAAVERGEVRCLTAPLRPLADAHGHVPLDPSTLPRLGRYDVLVLGGGTAGAPAAIAAAQAGVSVGLIESGPALGGVGTLGQITRYWFGNRDGFTAEIDRGVSEIEFREGFKRNNGSWSVAAKQAWYHHRCHELGVAMWLGSQGVGAWVVDGQVRGVVVACPTGYGLIEASAVVDSTGCADLPAAAGADTVTLGADHAAVQGTGLAGLTPSRDYHNSDHNFCDDTDVADTTTFFITSRRKFANHFDLGQLVDSRERRQIVGNLALDPVDILFNRRFPDTVCVATSNFDSHGFTTHPVFMLNAPDKKPLWADVPFRCLVPRGLRGVLVTGLAVSAHRDALPVIRMQADVQNQGYAAGYAAAMACRDQIDITEIDVHELQHHLVDIGALPDRVLTDRDSFPVDDARLDEAVNDTTESPASLALMFAERERALPRLRDAFAAADDAEARVRLALLLALMDDASGAAVLLDHVAAASWDKGWNYRGMGQFGRSLSPVDVAVIGLGTVGGAEVWPVLFQKVEQLRQRASDGDELPEFSHCRALAIAFEDLSARVDHPDATSSLLSLLELPDASDHAQTSLTDAMAALTDDTNENEVRNRSLRELYLARAIYRCGNREDVGRSTLEAYAQDVRGHFARHARAVLDEPTVKPLTSESVGLATTAR